jgi:hypothetical protein
MDVVVPLTFPSSSEVLSVVAKTQAGTSVSGLDASRIYDFIRTQATSSPLTNELIYGNYEVSYVGVGKNQREEGNPAGGRFRGRLGRFLYRNDGLYQHVLKPSSPSGNIGVVNYISGRIFGLLPLSIVLYGRAAPLSKEFVDALNQNITEDALKLSSDGVIQAFFDPPLLSLANKLTVKIGAASSVVLDSPYVDAQLRTGVGSRGSLFIFRRLVTESEIEISEGWRRVVFPSSPRPRLLSWLRLVITSAFKKLFPQFNTYSKR